MHLIAAGEKRSTLITILIRFPFFIAFYLLYVIYFASQSGLRANILNSTELSFSQECRPANLIVLRFNPQILSFISTSLSTFLLNLLEYSHTLPQLESSRYVPIYARHQTPKSQLLAPRRQLFCFSRPDTECRFQTPSDYSTTCKCVLPTWEATKWFTCLIISIERQSLCLICVMQDGAAAASRASHATRCSIGPQAIVNKLLQTQENLLCLLRAEISTETICKCLPTLLWLEYPPAWMNFVLLFFFPVRARWSINLALREKLGLRD